MTEQTDVTLPPAPPAGRRRTPAAPQEAKPDGRSREAREARTAAAAQVRSDAPDPAMNAIRERPTRADTVKKERRRRDGVDKTHNLKLGIRFELDPNYEYRWINHGVDGQRLKDLTVDDDWDMVSAEGEPSDGPGTALRRAVGESKTGPIHAYLCRKPKDLYESDHRKGQKRNDKMMQHIRAGKPPTDIARALKTSDHVYGADEIKLVEPGRS
jgi:hypothetical protein